LALYVLYTYLFDAFDISPLLVLTSPVKQCGKTRTQDLLAALVRSPVRATNASASSLFRLIEAQQVTLLLDEYDTFFTNQHDELRGIINGGHTRGSAYVLRSERDGDKFTVNKFSTWCPKILAGLNHLPATIEDRSIIVSMRRKARDQHLKRLRLSTLDALAAPWRQQLDQWATAALPALKGAAPVPIPDFGDRQNDNWEPLLAVADHVGGDWPMRAREAARRLAASATIAADQDSGILLLAHIRELFDSQEFVPSEELVGGLNSRDDGPWQEYGRDGKGLTPLRLAQRLEGFGIKPTRIRQGADNLRGYLRQAFEDTWRRYLP